MKTRTNATADADATTTISSAVTTAVSTAAPIVPVPVVVSVPLLSPVPAQTSFIDPASGLDNLGRLLDVEIGTAGEKRAQDVAVMSQTAAANPNAAAPTLTVATPKLSLGFDYKVGDDTTPAFLKADIKLGSVISTFEESFRQVKGFMSSPQCAFAPLFNTTQREAFLKSGFESVADEVKLLGSSFFNALTEPRLIAEETKQSRDVGLQIYRGLKGVLPAQTKPNEVFDVICMSIILGTIRSSAGHFIPTKQFCWISFSGGLSSSKTQKALGALQKILTTIQKAFPGIQFEILADASADFRSLLERVAGEMGVPFKFDHRKCAEISFLAGLAKRYLEYGDSLQVDGGIVNLPVTVVINKRKATGMGKAGPEAHAEQLKRYALTDLGEIFSWRCCDSCQKEKFMHLSLYRGMLAFRDKASQLSPVVSPICGLDKAAIRAEAEALEARTFELGQESRKILTYIATEKAAGREVDPVKVKSMKTQVDVAQRKLKAWRKSFLEEKDGDKYMARLERRKIGPSQVALDARRAELTLAFPTPNATPDATPDSTPKAKEDSKRSRSQTRVAAEPKTRVKAKSKKAAPDSKEMASIQTDVVCGEEDVVSELSMLMMASASPKVLKVTQDDDSVYVDTALTVSTRATSSDSKAASAESVFKTGITIFKAPSASAEQVPAVNIIKDSLLDVPCAAGTGAIAGITIKSSFS